VNRPFRREPARRVPARQTWPPVRPDRRPQL